MRKNKMMRTAAGLMVATLLTASVMSGTFAKYTTTQSAADTAKVAKWSFQTNDAGNTETSFTMDHLFATNAIYEIDKDATAATEDAHVLTGSTDGIIAPGTWGYQEIKVVYTTEVSANYTVEFSVDKDVEALKYALVKQDTAPVDATGVEDAEWKSTITGCNKTVTDITPSADEKTDTYYLVWKWDFENSDNTTDALDTAEGITPKSPTVTAKVTATQID